MKFLISNQSNDELYHIDADSVDSAKKFISNNLNLSLQWGITEYKIRTIEYRGIEAIINDDCSITDNKIMLKTFKSKKSFKRNATIFSYKHLSTVLFNQDKEILRLYN